jgi:hypothetical protein
MSKKKKPNFNLTFKDYDKKETLCLLSLSDAWRRGAQFDKPALSQAFNSFAKSLCSGVTKQESARRSTSTNEINRAFEKMIKLAERENIERIILPIYSRSASGKFVRKNCLNNYSGEVKVELQSTIYESKLDHIGKVDKRRKTSFDYGMANIK